MGRIEGGCVYVRRREDRDLRRVQSPDDTPVVRLGAADARGKIVGDEERTGRSIG
jgi:hypothetical protein